MNKSVKEGKISLINQINIAVSKTEILDKMAPIKTIQVRSNYLPWMSEATKNKIKMRITLLPITSIYRPWKLRYC